MSGMVHRGKMVSGGRVQVPAEVRRELGLTDGDSLRIDVVDGALRIRSTRDMFKRMSEELRKYIPEGVSLADELIADRRAEAARE